MSVDLNFLSEACQHAVGDWRINQGASDLTIKGRLSNSIAVSFQPSQVPACA